MTSRKVAVEETTKKQAAKILGIGMKEIEDLAAAVGAGDAISTANLIEMALLIDASIPKSSRARKRKSKQLTPPFVQIAVSSSEGADTLYGLDEQGRVWMYRTDENPPEGWLLFSQLCGNPSEV